MARIQKTSNKPAQVSETKPMEMATPLLSIPENTGLKIGNTQLLILTGLMAIAYYVFSFSSEGFYQQDEAAHFLSMLRFWHDNKTALSNWAKPGYKVLYALPALGGSQFVTFVNCLFAAFTGYFAYKAAEAKGCKSPLLAFVLLIAQPFWIMLAFRNYSEIPSAFLLVLGYYFYATNKTFFSALCISYICTIRQEFYPIAIAFGLFLLLTKNWIAAFSLAIFPFCQNVWGGLITGDPIYLYHQIFAGSDSIKDAYPRQGFDHYFKTSIVVFGPVVVTLFVTWLATLILNKKQPDWVLLFPSLGFFLLNCLINMKDHSFGPSTGGNLRYMLIISPLLAIAGVMALDEFRAMKEKWKVLFFLVPLAILVGAYLNHKHNFILLQEETDPKPLMGVIFTIAFLFIPVIEKTYAWLFIGLLAFTGLINVRTVKLSEEDKTCKQLAQWYKSHEAELDKKQVFVNHTMFYYFMGKTEYDFPIPPMSIADTLGILRAKPGSVIIWDSHYSFRPNLKRGINYDYFTNQPTKFKMTDQLMAKDQSFGVFIFDKL